MLHTFSLTTEYIELNKLLKIYDLVDSGGHAKAVISDGLVLVNGKVETRIRNKLKSGDMVRFNDAEIVIE